MNIFHAVADLLYHSVPYPPFAFEAIKEQPVLILLFEVTPYMPYLLLVAGITNVDDLGAVVHQVRPTVAEERRSVTHFD